ncbi:MAG: P-II family nitrogen regulator [Methanoregula sp.]|jgi:nitrogen regulatory protein PII|nr:P-II family nitrogen regulator [Methanoregula sp.]
MKMIWVIIQSRSVQRVIEALEKTGITAITRIGVNDSDSEPEILPGPPGSCGRSREMLMIVLSEHDVAKAVIAIRTAAKADLRETPESGDLPNGKIFVTYVEDFYTIRIAQKDGATIQHEKDHCHYPE